MNDSQRYEVTILADAVHDKRERYEMLGMMNTPSDPDAKRKTAIEFELAKAEYYEALGALWKAQDALISS